jgi:hypothetical protein
MVFIRLDFLHLANATAMAAGGTSQRWYPAWATVASRERMHQVGLCLLTNVDALGYRDGVTSTCGTALRM